MDWTGLPKAAEKFAADNSPAILTGIGAAGVALTAYLTGKATFKAADAIRMEEAKYPFADAYYLNNKEVFVLVWKLYIPAASVGVISVASIIGANRIGTRRTAALAAAYSLSEKAYEEYREKVKEKLTGPKAQAIQDELAQDRVSRTEGSTLVIVGDGKVLCFDSYTARYFESSMEEIKKAQNDINYKILNYGYAALGDFYMLLGLAATTMGDEVGWTSDKLMELEYSTTLSEEGKPCLSIDFVVHPVRGYHKFG